MTLSYDQRSELRWAFEEAYVEPERRRSARIRHKVVAKIAPWRGKPRSTRPIEVIIEDFSTTGVGLVNSEPLKEDDRYLLEVPRPSEKPIWVVLRVVRCLPMDSGMYAVGLEACELVDCSTCNFNPFTGITTLSQKLRLMSRRTKILFLIFGIVGLALAAFL